MIERKNAFTISKKEQDAYINGVTALITDGSYGKLVEIHTRMRKHNMHSMTGITGTKRFLPWHRAYLLHFEKALRTKEKDAFIPYLKWSDGGVPPWLSSFKPEVKVNGSIIKNTRNNLTTAISSQTRIKQLQAIKTYLKFTSEIESNPHNTGHVRIGGAMQTMASPSDPIFFMHHAEVDRVWSDWQKGHTDTSDLKGPNAIMDPWANTVTSLNSTTTLGYKYL